MTLIETLAKGWGQNPAPRAHEFAQRWAEKLQATIQIRPSTDNQLHFVCDLSNIRLHGMSEVHCLLLGGERLGALETSHQLKQWLNQAGGLPIVLAASQLSFDLAQMSLPSGRCLLLAPLQLEELLGAPEPAAQLKQWLRQQIPLRRLIPYNHLLSVEGSMFFGRNSELDRLVYQSEVSYAVAGPGRIGKTSLIKQYRRRLLRENDPQAPHTFYVDFYHCPKDANSVARFLALKLEESRRSREVTANKLLAFLHYQRFKLGAPLNLLLDEVDLVCQSEAFSVLGEAAKLGYCRLILVGKGELLKMMLYSETQLRQRLLLLRLSPLEEKDARDLLLEPLADLGFELEDAEQLVAQVFCLTGRMPHLMQFFARKLAELAIDEGQQTLSAGQVETLKWDFETAQFFISPLEATYLEDPQVRLVAFLLLKERPREINPGQVRTLARRWGLPFDEMQALKLCNELVIHNVLVWDKGAFKLANEALVDYAQHLGILDGALETARRTMQQ